MRGALPGGATEMTTDSGGNCMPSPILNLAEVQVRTLEAGDNPKRTPPDGYDVRWGEIASRIGARKLGYHLTVSTMAPVEICEYPDSGKFGAFASGASGPANQSRFRHIGKAEDAHDYWEGE